jgi:arsenite methyltransferase
MTQNTIHEVVQNLYGTLADSTGDCQCSGCCGTETIDPAAIPLYDPKTLSSLPTGAVNLSLGCGNPLSFAHLQAGETVLDLGSGGGIDCFLAAQEVGPTGYVIGIDMTPAMLARANANKQQMGVENVEFRQGLIEEMPVADRSVDVIISNCVINLAPDKSVVFKEAFRVLKPQGRLAVSDIVTEGEFSPELRAQTELWAECVSGAIDVTDYVRLLETAGFMDIHVIDKFDAEGIVQRQEGMPSIFSASITAHKP